MKKLCTLVICSSVCLFVVALVGCLHHVRPAREVLTMVGETKRISDTTHGMCLLKKVSEMDLDGDGVNDYRQEDFMRGKRLVLTVIFHKAATTYIFPVGDYTFIAYDGNGDGKFDNVSILKGENIREVFIRNQNGVILPVDRKRLSIIKENASKANNLITDIIQSVKNKDRTEMEKAINNIREVKPVK